MAIVDDCDRWRKAMGEERDLLDALNDALTYRSAYPEEQWVTLWMERAEATLAVVREGR